MTQSGASLVYEFGEFQLDAAEGVLRQGGHEVPLSPTLLGILVALVENSGRIVTKEYLIERVWPDRIVEEGNLARNVSYLRKALGSGAQALPYIQTIQRRGYRFTAAVRIIQRRRDPPPELCETGFEPAQAARRTSIRLTRRVVLGVAGSLAALTAAQRIFRTSIRATAVSPGMQSLVVLPFEDISDDHEGQLFASGMTEALISDLGRINALKVISRTTAMRFVRTSKSLPDVARELGVQGVVEGSIVLSGGRIRVTARLVDAAGDRQLWTDSYERELENILDLQREIARSISRRIAIVTSPDERRLLHAATRPINLEAHQAYLRGLFLKDTERVASLHESISYFELSLKRDPRFAPAYGAMADAYLMLGTFQGPSTEYWPIARKYAAMALEIDDLQAEAHSVRAGVTMCYDFRKEEARREYEFALDLDPGSSMALRRYGYCLGSLGQFEQSLVPLRRSIEIDPMSYGNRIMMGSVLYLAGRLDEAEAEFLSILTAVEDHPSANRYLALIALQRRAYTEAFKYFEQAMKRGGTSGIAGELAFAHAVAGQSSEALRLGKDLKKHEKYPGSADYSLALVYAGLGEVDTSLEWFEKACKARDYRLVLANVDPIWSSVRSDPRFGRLTAQLGISSVSPSKLSTS